MSVTSLAIAALLMHAAPAEAPPPASADAPAAAAPVKKSAAEEGAVEQGVEEGTAEEGAVPSIPFERAALDNGLELIIHTDTRTPVVCIDVWYRVGAFDEERGKSGLAHLLERLMFQGSKHNPGDGHVKLLESAGASALSSTTSFDYTSFYACVPKNEIELLLWLEADRMAWLMEVVDQTTLDEQRRVVSNERRQQVENVPYAPARAALWQAIFPDDHPYRGQVIGSVDDLERVSLDDARMFYHRYYTPANATMLISGDVDVADARKFAEKYFRSFPKWDRPNRRAVSMPRLNTEVRLDLEDRLAQLTLVTVAFFVPPAFQNGSADIEVLAHLLGDGNASRLHQALVVDGKLARSVRATISAAANVSVLQLEVVVRPDANVDDVINAIQAQLDLLQDLPPSPEELARAVETFETRRLFSLQHPLGRAEALQAYHLFAGDAAFLAKDLARYRAVTPDTTLSAVNGFLTKDRRAVAVVRPAGTTPTTTTAPGETEPPPAATPAPEPAQEGE